MGGKKRKKDEGGASSSWIAEDDSDDDCDKYKPFKVDNYCRQYPEDGGDYEYMVIYESSDESKPIGDRDLMGMGAALKNKNKGIKRLKRINRYKIAVIYERPGLANAALNNIKALKDLNLKATIPAKLTEVIGVIKNVPVYMSNHNIYNGLSSGKNVVSVRRFLRRARDDEGNSILLPTTSVAITFACPILPGNIDINSWYFEVSPYTAPVNQCLRCLRYNHIAKYCKNAQRCSICGADHHFKQCTKNSSEAVCIHCSGNHIAISNECPVKKQRIEENKIKTRKASYADLFNKNAFPALNNKSDPIDILLKSDHFINLLISSITKLIMTRDKDPKSPINSESIKGVLIETFSTKTDKNLKVK